MQYESAAAIISKGYDPKSLPNPSLNSYILDTKLPIGAGLSRSC